MTTLYSFCSQSECTDGKVPASGLIQATEGNFYGTTEFGGAYSSGTVFKITPGGTLTTLYSFCSENESVCKVKDGQSPQAGVIQAANGDFYGTTGAINKRNAGTVFKITPSGKLTTLHEFDGSDGGRPYASLMQATTGDLYGTTSTGGPPKNGGTVFEITPSGTTTTTLYNFCSQSDCTDGQVPYSGLVQATNGDFYATTALGGAYPNAEQCLGGCGTVYKLTSTGALTTLHSFCAQTNSSGSCTDGSYVYAGLIQATDGNFYGTTEYGGANNLGTIFRITPSGTLTTLHSFAMKEGTMPYAGLMQATNGDFYGTTPSGGIHDDGTVFSLSVGLGPFVKTQTSAGPVGASVHILGTDLTGSTSVTFNGTAATFTIDSASLITTTVPAGATTGDIEVVTPGGTLKSNMKYRVTP